MTVGTSQPIEISRTVRSSPALLVGIGFSIMALLPVLGPGPFSAARALTAALLGAVAVFLVRAGRRRTRVAASFDPGRKTVRLDGGEPIPLGDARIVLEGRLGPSKPLPETYYEATLELDSRRVVQLSESDDPAVVLSEIGSVLSAIDLPVRTGWGLADTAAPWEPMNQGAAALAPSDRAPIELRPEASKSAKSSGLTVIVMGIGIGAVMAVMVSSQLQKGGEVSALSYALPTLAIAVMLVAGAALVSRHQRLRVDGEIVLETRVLGLPIATVVIDRADVGDVHLVSPDGADPRHVLVQTARGPVSVSCSPAEAASMRDAILRRA